MSILTGARRASLTRLLLMASLGAIVAGCGRSADDAKGVTAASNSLPSCVAFTAHQLDVGEPFKALREIHVPTAINYCEQAVRDNPGSASAHEHLARAYLADANKRQDAAAEQKGLNALKEAIRLGSPYATAVGALSLPGVDRAAAVRLLQPMIDQRNPGAMMLLASLDVTDGGRVRPINDLHREGVMQQFAAAARAGGAQILSAWVLGLMGDGNCGRLAPVGSNQIARQPDMNAELFCGEILVFAADGGDVMASMQLGLSHLMAALEYADKRSEVSLWRTRMNEEKAAARHRLLAVQASDDGFFSPLAGPLLARINTIEMQPDRASREFWGKVLIGGLALLAAADSGASSGQGENPMDAVQRRQRESEQHLRCMRAKSYVLHYSNDTTEVGAAQRGYAAGC